MTRDAVIKIERKIAEEGRARGLNLATVAEESIKRRTKKLEEIDKYD
jgi:post-segregation antitoxin (ccd killing protein)